MAQPSKNQSLHLNMFTLKSVIRLFSVKTLNCIYKNKARKALTRGNLKAKVGFSLFINVRSPANPIKNNLCLWLQ